MNDTTGRGLKTPGFRACGRASSRTQKLSALLFRPALACLLIALASLGSSRAGAQPSDSSSFLFVADPEITASGGTDPLAELAAQIRTMQLRPSFVVAGGNLTAHGSPDEYARLQQDASALQSAGAPLYAVPGSRDVRWCPNGKESFAHVFGKLYQSFDRAGAHLILLDTTVYLQSLGHLDRAELEWLSKDLAKLKPETPILVFCCHGLGQGGPGSRPLDNEYDLIDMLRKQNVVAIFCGQPHADQVKKTSGITTISVRSLGTGPKYLVRIDPALVRVDRPGDGAALTHVATLPVTRRAHPSILKSAWDDPDIPYLERRRPAVTLEPRAVADNPEDEKARYRIDDGPWKPMTKDARDVWRDTFPTRGIPVGVHAADIDLTTSSGVTEDAELVFEVERDTRDANRKWALNLDGPIQAGPLAYENLIVVPCLDGKVYALDAQSGKHRWTFSTKGAFVAPAAMEGSALAGAAPRERSTRESRSAKEATLYAGGTDHYLYAMDAATGHLRWKFDAGAPIFAQPAVASGVVCFGVAGRVYGLDAVGGQMRWSQPAGGWFQCAAATDGSAFFLNSWDGAVYAFRATTGEPVWTTKIEIGDAAPAPRSGSPAGMPASPAVAAPALFEGRVYICMTDGTLHALDAATGKPQWTTRVPNGADPLGISAPVVREATIYVAGTGDHGDVYAFDARTGEERWRSSTGQAIYNSSPAIAPDGKSLAIMSVRGRVSVLDAATGNRLWAYELGPGNTFSTPAYDGSVVYTTTMADDVQALNGPGVAHMPSEPVARPPKR
jgi:outer membrane protein assembly factor BamB/3',5'-cyclic AMP phosphodiesterase CpdA